jgi:hypothetical protein
MIEEGPFFFLNRLCRAIAWLILFSLILWWWCTR